MELGKYIVRHCGSLPLAIVVLGGLLATKHELDEWEMVRRKSVITLARAKAKVESQEGRFSLELPCLAIPSQGMLSVFEPSSGRRLAVCYLGDRGVDSTGRGYVNPYPVDVCVTGLNDLPGILNSPILSNSYRLVRYSSFRIHGNFLMQEEQNLLRQLLGFHHLQKMYLGGFLNLVKMPNQFPPNLTKLTLNISYLREDPMPTLKKLSNLRSLSLEFECLHWEGDGLFCSNTKAPSNEIGGSYSCGSGGFPELKFLFLYGIHTLEEWMVEEGAMPSLLLLGS
ncbi:hypothetical protein Acr_06g0016860 [Actinidia rufa]|uniref:NB-ARC domain-containing disease resistance protein n=1 Tax=Actinidia rufa TaxID=165716 RepID=A0A7J0EU57_9ERIC|nr:hypothetical protein Acr_06g0016860 [Actinidia rufa]